MIGPPKSFLFDPSFQAKKGSYSLILQFFPQRIGCAAVVRNAELKKWRRLPFLKEESMSGN